MTHDQISNIARAAIQRVHYDRYGLSEGVLSIRYIDKTDMGWKVAFWLKGTIAQEVHIVPAKDGSDESVTIQIVQSIEANLPNWRELVTSASR